MGEAIKSKSNSRRTRWILGILVVVFIAFGFTVVNSINERKHVEYVVGLGGLVGRKQWIPLEVQALLPKQLRPYIPKGSVDSISFSLETLPADFDRILEKFPSLSRLYLSGTRITDEFLKKVSTHPQLKDIYLNSTNVSEEGIRILSQSRSLTEISLDATKISDASITHLSQMKQLRRLSVARSPLTDKSIEMFCQMPNLVLLDVSGTRITADGLKRLRAVLLGRNQRARVAFHEFDNPSHSLPNALKNKDGNQNLLKLRRVKHSKKVYERGATIQDTTEKLLDREAEIFTKFEALMERAEKVLVKFENDGKSS